MGDPSQETTFSVPRSLPTKRASQVFLPSPPPTLSRTAPSTNCIREVAQEHYGAGVRKSCSMQRLFFLCSSYTFPSRRPSFNPPCNANYSARGVGMCISGWLLPQEMLSFRTSTFANELSISGSSAAHIATSPPRSSSRLHERARPWALPAAICFGVRGVAIVCTPPTGYPSYGASLSIIPGRPDRRASVPAKYSAKCVGHGHTVLEVVTEIPFFKS